MAFIMERSRQLNINDKIASISKKIKYIISENPACVGKFMISGDHYTPKPGDRSIIKNNRDTTENLKVLVEMIESEVTNHDSSLFINSGRKLKSGRDCHHTFNNYIKKELATLKTQLMDLNNSLDKYEKKYLAIWVHKNKPSRISDAKRKTNNKFKSEKRRKQHMLNKVLNVFISLGGDADGDYYSPTYGIPQITSLEIPLEDLTHRYLTDCLELLVKDGCFAESALEDVQLFLAKQKRENFNSTMA